MDDGQDKPFSRYNGNAVVPAVFCVENTSLRLAVFMVK